MNFALYAAVLAASLATAAPGTPATPAPQETTARSQGQRLYDQGDYKAAAAWYLQAIQADPRDAGLHYNYANALYKNGQRGKAIAAYQRAFDMRPRDADVRQNLDFALRKAGEELAPSGIPPLLFATFHFLSERELAGLQWLACWLLLILAGLCLQRPALRPALAAWIFAAAVAWLALAGWWLAVRGLPRPRRGVIISASAEIRGGPGDNFNVSFTAPEGRRVQIFSADGDWLEIGVAKEGAKGWIPASAVEEL